MKNKSLSLYFTLYTLKIIMVPITLLIFMIAAIIIGGNQGFIRWANYLEQKIEENREIIENAETVTADMIPEEVEYLVLNRQKDAIIDYGNMQEEHLQEILTYLDDQFYRWPSGPDYAMVMFIESTNSICVMRYSMLASYSSSWLRSHLPPPAVFLICVFFILFFICVSILCRNAVHSLKKELNKIKGVTEKISAHDLDFVSVPNSFNELQEVTESLNHLRDALKLSLKEQIQLEQAKTEQISALAHDVKIPATVIQGNAELLTMTPLTPQQAEFTADIHSSVLEIESYIQKLITVSKLATPIALHKEEIQISTFIDTIKESFTPYTRQFPCHLQLNPNLPLTTTIPIDLDLLKRAILNILLNSLQHAGQNVRLQIDLALPKNTLILNISDNGPGFTPEALQHATDLFYTTNNARTQTGNYGIGLNFVHQTIQAHGGHLTITNNTIQKGACIHITLPVIPSHP